jgi:orotate phosphoribosyltransferase
MLEDLSLPAFGQVTLWILSVGGLLSILDYVGLMPPFLAKWLARNKLATTLKAMRMLGVRVAWGHEQQSMSMLQRILDSLGIREPAFKLRLRELLEQDTFDGQIEVGETRRFTSEGFIDLMGASTDTKRSVDYARILNTFASIERIEEYDFIATPKDGSPILGYEFSRLVHKPLVLGTRDKARDGGAMGHHVRLDFPKGMTLQGKQGLLVDDSTTGGGKMLALAKELSAAGATVKQALVLFEPKGKRARELLREQGIHLISMVDGPLGRF